MCNYTTIELNSLCESGQVRLVGGQEEYEGRVEICRGSTWATICDPSWNDADAQVTCRQLGYSTTGTIIKFSCIPIFCENSVNIPSVLYR